MKWLVTGGCGFIGQELVAQLVRDRQEVVVVDANTSAATGWNRVLRLIGSGLVCGDVCDWPLMNILMENKPDVVVHCAAQSHVDASLVNPQSTWQSNAMGTNNVAMACTLHDVPMLYCSTDEVYGSTPLDDDGCVVPVTEDAPLNPSSPYSASKLAGEHAVRALGHSSGLKWAITRGSNAWGPWQLTEKLIPIACRLLQSGDRVPLHGGGHQLRQWIHVSDFGFALRRAAEALVAGSGHGKTWNIAGPQVLSVREVVAMLAEACGRDVEPDFAWDCADRPGQDTRYVISGQRMRLDLQVQPERRLTNPQNV
ncbi:MAG: dTDP-glucose 4,6-dehydratase, partial [Halioglobus sp.]